MPQSFATIPKAPAYRIANARVPVDLAPNLAKAPHIDRLASCDIVIENGRIAALGPLPAQFESLPAVDLDGGMALPRFVDVHTHLDKGHISARAPNPDGTFFAARETVAKDREAHWSAEDVRARMDFALRCAFAHGTGAIRTHLDSIGKQTAISWPVFAELRDDWKGRIALQAVPLFTTDIAADDEPQFRSIVATAAKHGGLLGAVTFLGQPPDAKLELALDRIFGAALAHGLDLDFHVDESCALDARSLERIAAAALRHRFKGRIVAGHCCALTQYADADRARVIDAVRAAGIAVVSLPMCNMYLQDRAADRTPRLRGVAPLHELDAAGVPIMVASDNTRDPFYAYGDLDMLEVFREATRILHFDHSERPWIRLIGTTAADMMGLAGKGTMTVGMPADLVLTRARTPQELMSRPQWDRVVVVAGRQIDTTLPDYRELDRLFAPVERSVAGG
jgi:cytosine deaminase